jgi:hypothetical protein
MHAQRLRVCFIQVMTTEVLRSMLYRGSEIVREAALVVRRPMPSQRTRARFATTPLLLTWHSHP